MECGYHTLQQCLIIASGLGGTCIPNPYYEWRAMTIAGSLYVERY